MTNFLSLHTFYLVFVLYTYISLKKSTCSQICQCADYLEALGALPRAKIGDAGSTVPSAAGSAPVAASDKF